MAGDGRFIKDNPARECERYLAYLKAACPPIALGLREGLAPLSLETRSVYLHMLAHLVRFAPEGGRVRQAELEEQSERRYRTNLRLVERLKHRPRLCKLKSEFILEQIACLRQGIDISFGSEREAYTFAVSTLIHLLGHFIRADAGLSIVPDLLQETSVAEAANSADEPKALPCIPPPPPRLAQVIQFPAKRPS